MTPHEGKKLHTLLRAVACLFFFAVFLTIDAEASLSAEKLQTCIDECKKDGLCCGNRINGEAPTSSNNRLSCANGCEIAYYSKLVTECQEYCDLGNKSSCAYKHPFIDKEFSKCNNCQAGCDGWPPENACKIGCTKAESLDGFYNPCMDDPEWGYKGKKSKTCSNWVNAKTNKYCKKKEKKGIHKGKKVWQICPETCRCEFETCTLCDTSCTDNEAFKYEESSSKMCKNWVKKNKEKRCKLEGVSENCPETCKSTREVSPCQDGGQTVEKCIKKKWKNMGCLKRTSIGLGAGFHPADVIRSSRIYGWSYYIRAFDIVRDEPVEELGYGQWTSGDIIGGSREQEVCGLNPHSFVCDVNNPPSDDEMNGEYKNCGSMDKDTLEQCKAGCCGTKDKCGVGGGTNVEGGMGYWMYTLQHPHVKWSGLAAVTHHYEMIGRTFLDLGPQMCTSLGGAVRVANNLVVGNDPMQFYSEKKGDVDGFLGYMITRTPIGKRSNEDNANYWTIIIDAENYSGPVYYVSAWFWDALSSWNKNSKTMGNPESLITYAQTGFEGSIGAVKLTAEDGSEWVKTNRVAAPQDVIDGVLSETSTFYTGFSTYKSDWATDAMEPTLSGIGEANKQSIEFIKKSALESREQTAQCHEDYSYNGWLRTYRAPWQLYSGTRDIDWRTTQGFGIGDDFLHDDFDKNEYRAESIAASCHLRFNLDTSKLQCSSGFCEAYRYLRLESQNSEYSPTDEKDVPKSAQEILNSVVFEPTRMNDGTNLGLPGDNEKPCFEKPGPVSDLYCTRLLSGTWLGFKWYRFVDQPELNQVFSSMKKTERDEAKCFMQARIERLHHAIGSGEKTPQWFSAPQGDSKLPKSKVSFDPGYLVTPPKGLEIGFVPIVLWERNREVPEGCSTFLGDYDYEPEPFPEGYYEGYSGNGNGYRVRQQCPANLESNGPFTMPGKIYPYPHKNYGEPQAGYNVPNKENVGDILDAETVTCGLPSDP